MERQISGFGLAQPWMLLAFGGVTQQVEDVCVCVWVFHNGCNDQPNSKLPAAFFDMGPKRPSLPASSFTSSTGREVDS